MKPRACGDCIYYNQFQLSCRLWEMYVWSTTAGCDDGETPTEGEDNNKGDANEQD